MRCDADSWSVELDCHLDVTGNGVVDVVRFDVPVHWGEPLKVDPPSDVEFVELPGESRRRLLVRPRDAIDASYRIRVAAPLAISPGERVHVPEIVPLDVDRLDRFLVVPTRLQQQPIQWETRGLKSVSRPPDFPETEFAPESFDWYRVVGQRPQARLESVKRGSGVPEVPLADIHVAWQLDGACFGVATFDLKPAGLSGCTLRLPDSFRLVQATVAGMPALMHPLQEKNLWRLALGSRQLPQRIEVVFAGKLSESDVARGGFTVPAPVLREVDVERTLWTIRGPDRFGTGIPEPADSRIGGTGQEMCRLQAAMALVDLPPDVVAESGREEIDRWYLRWARRMAAARRRIARQWRQPPREGRFDPLDSERIDREQAEVAERLGVTPLGGRVAREATLVGDPAAVLDAVTRRQREVTHCTFKGAAGSASLRYPPDRSDLLVRLLAALALVTVTALVMLARCRTIVGDWLMRWPQAAGVMAGLAWWLWLTPSWLGWLIVLISLSRGFGIGVFRKRQNRQAVTPQALGTARPAS